MKYKFKITEIYVFKEEIEVDSEEEARDKLNKIYYDYSAENEDKFIADALSYEDSIIELIE